MSILVDLDGTLATYPHPGRMIGLPVPAMVERVKEAIESGVDVRIFTARASLRGTSGWPRQERAIKAWCRLHLDAELPITNEKDFTVREIWDDIARQVVFNKGQIVEVVNG